MPRIHRFTRRLSYVWVVAMLLPFGCTLITDIDRSKIPAPALIEPDPVPSDGGIGEPTLPVPDAGPLPEPPDAATDAAAPAAEPDAGGADAAANAADGG